MMYSALLAGVGLVSGASAACSRAKLQEATAAYVQAQTAGDTSIISALASNLSYAENDVTLDIADGVLGQPVAVDFNRSLYDTTECATFTELSAATNAHPYVIHTRMLFDDGDGDGDGGEGEAKITAIQSVVSDAGDWIFNATSHLYWTRQEAWDPIPEGERDGRDVIRAAGDAYLDSWSDGSVRVPYGTPCARLEGGAYTGERNPAANTCTMPQFPEAFVIANRRYIIDEELGGLDIFNDFPFIDTDSPDGTPSSNFIRVEGGKLRYIHEVTVCTNPGCGR